MLRRYLVLAGLLVLLVTPGHALAKGGPPSVVTITGPGLSKPVTVRGAATRPLGMLALMTITCSDPNTCGCSMQPAHLGPAYTITRDGIDRLRYYPTRDRNPGFIFYIGLIQNGGSSEYDGRWFRATLAGNRALRRILAMHGVRVGSGT